MIWFVWAETDTVSHCIVKKNLTSVCLVTTNNTIRNVVYLIAVTKYMTMGWMSFDTHNNHWGYNCYQWSGVDSYQVPGTSPQWRCIIDNSRAYSECTCGPSMWLKLQPLWKTHSLRFLYAISIILPALFSPNIASQSDNKTYRWKEYTSAENCLLPFGSRES